TLTWNALNQPISVNSTTATYDALGRMVEKGSGGTYTQFVYRPSGAMLAVYSGSLSKGTIPLPGGSTAIYNGTGLNYIRHKDWLGSSRLATTWAHAVYSKEAYAPFGETYNEDGTPDRSFTGQDQNVATGSGGSGVYDFLFRKYDPSAGRWLSPDPAGWSVVDTTDPQSLDRYTYVENQPVNWVDPYGLSPPCGGFYAVSGDDDGPEVSPGLTVSFSNNAWGLGSDSYGPEFNCSSSSGGGGNPTAAPSNAALTPQAQGCQAKIQGAVNNALNTNSTFLGPTTGPGMSPMGYRNGAYNFNYFAPGVINPVAGSNGGSGRFPGSGLHIPLPGGQDPTITPWGYNAQAGGSYFTAHYDSANPTDDLVSFFEHIINDVILRRAHGC
ncbi:MAG: RHS repeat-associated core domain-containing protein, partial [Terracidiphilus sp.]